MDDLPPSWPSFPGDYLKTPTPDDDSGLKFLTLDTPIPHRAPYYDAECMHYGSFSQPINFEVEEGPLPVDHEITEQHIEPTRLFAHPNRYFTRELCKQFFIFSQDENAPRYPKTATDKLSDNEEHICQKLWIFGQEPRNALLINEVGVHYIGQDMYPGPGAPQARVVS